MVSRFFQVVGLLLLTASLSFAQPGNSLHVNQLSMLAVSDSADDFGINVIVRGSLAYCLMEFDGLHIINIADPVHPIQIGYYSAFPNNGFSTDSSFAYLFYSSMAISGRYAYVLAGPSGLHVVDILDPYNPVEVAHNNSIGGARIVVIGNYAYITGMQSGALCAANIANPTTQTVVGCIDFFDPYPEMGNFTVVGDYAYCAAYWSGFHVIRIADPDSLTEVAFRDGDFSGELSGVAVTGNYAYVADNDYGIKIINIENPANPMLVGQYEAWYGTRDVAVDGDYAYVVNTSSGLHVVNISNPSTPYEVGYYNYYGSSSTCIALSGCTVFMMSGRHIGIYDISYFNGPSLPRAPDNLVIHYLSGNSRLRLNWSPVSQNTNGLPITVSRYTIFRSDTVNGTTWDSIGSAAASSTPEFYDSTATNRNGFYRVKAVTN